MTEKPRETQAESHVVELKEKVNNSSLMKHHRTAPDSVPDCAHHRTGLHKGTVVQRSSERRVFKGFGVAKRYCRIDLIGDTVVQC